MTFDNARGIEETLKGKKFGADASDIHYLQSLILKFVTNDDVVLDLAQELWLRCEEHNRLPDVVHWHPNERIAKHIVYDYFRRLRIEERAKNAWSNIHKQTLFEHEYESDNDHFLGELLETSNLTPEESLLIYLRFWRHNTVLEIKMLTHLKATEIEPTLNNAMLKLYAKARQ